jgi:aryl-alcohol dehydrogenase-like predicted oxidoreductase
MAMESREIGQSGIRASVIGLGCNNFGFFQNPAQTTACIAKALDVGITFFDMASEHGEGKEEALVGAALGSQRRDVVIATKFGQQELIGVGSDGGLKFSNSTQRQGASRRWIMEAVEESLKRLKTDYIDLYQPHVIDPAVPAEEMLRALDDLVRQGKVRAIGLAATNANSAQMVALQETAEANGWTPFVSMQTQYNMLVRDAEAEIIPTLRQRHMSLFPFWPLANGLLTGKYRMGTPNPTDSRLEKLPMVKDFSSPEQWVKMEKLREFANARLMSMVELAFAWLLSEPAVTSVIAGATKPEQVTQNAAAAGKRLSADDLGLLGALLR